MPFAALKHTKTHYVIQGEGIPLIAVHGLSADLNVWAELIPYLKTRFKILNLDIRGSGQTHFNGQPFTINDLADDIVELLDYCQINKAFLIGHSMGGLISQNFAMRYTDRIHGLICLNSATDLNAVTRQALGGIVLSRQKYKIHPEDVVRLILPWSYSREFLSIEGQVEKYIEMVKENPFYISAENFALQWQAIDQYDWKNCFPLAISVPVLILAGGKDLLTPTEGQKELAQALPQSVYREDPHAAHCMLIENPSWVFNCIEDFLNKMNFHDA